MTTQPKPQETTKPTTSRKKANKERSESDEEFEWFNGSDNIDEANSFESHHPSEQSCKMIRLISKISYVDQTIMYYQQQLHYLYKYRAQLYKKLSKPSKHKKTHSRLRKSEDFNEKREMATQQPEIYSDNCQHNLPQENSQTSNYSHMYYPQYYGYPYYMNYPYYQTQPRQNDTITKDKNQENDKEEILKDYSEEEEEEEDDSEIFLDNNIPLNKSLYPDDDQDDFESSSYWDQYLWH